MADALFWRRTDTAGGEHTIYTDRAGLRAHGTALAASPVPYTCRYEIATDEAWATTRCEVNVEGAGFLRSVRLEHAAGRWRVTATEQGNLDAALLAAGHSRAEQPGCDDPGTLYAAVDVDLGGSPLTNTLPIRRLGILNSPGVRHTVEVAWILVPSLVVVAAQQTYLANEDGVVAFSSGSFAADLQVDERGYIRHYPGLADRA